LIALISNAHPVLRSEHVPKGVAGVDTRHG
jgi:hypothetical protein